MFLVGAALVIAVVVAFSIGALTAMALSGGDGEARNSFFGILGALVGFGALWNVAMCLVAFRGLAEWQWWSMLVPGTAAVLGLVLLLPREPGSWREKALWMVLQPAFFVPAVLLLLADAVGT